MTQFPAVLANMNQNLAWTSELGDAYVNQGEALNQAIQTMRQKGAASREPEDHSAGDRNE